MNSLTVIGNLTKDPELRSTPDGISVCNFTVAVNRKKTRSNQDPGADYFRITAWRERGENCAKWLKKGSKVCVIGAVSASAYIKDGVAMANLEIKAAEEVEFLSQRTETDCSKPVSSKKDERSGFEQVETDELPF